MIKKPVTKEFRLCFKSRNEFIFEFNYFLTIHKTLNNLVLYEFLINRFMKNKIKEQKENPKETIISTKNEENPLYKITSPGLLESLYLMLKKYEKYPPVFESTLQENEKIFNYNYQQMKIFFENIFRIKFLNICKPAIKIFLKKFQAKHLKKSKSRQDSIAKKNKKIKEMQKKVPLKENIPSPNPKCSESIIEPSQYNNNLSFNILKSVEQCNAHEYMTDYLNTKKKRFEESIRQQKEFTSPDLIGNEAFNKIQLTTVKKRGC